MTSDRKALMSGKDNTAFSRVKRKLARENQESKQKKKWEDESASCSAAVLSDSTTTMATSTTGHDIVQAAAVCGGWL